MTSRAKKVFVGLSGGVDSSVSAALLKEQDYDVTGVFIKTWHPNWLACNWKEERRDAMRVCAKLNIPFLLCDGTEAYKQGVVDYMVSEYKAGRTPNPDVMCNKTVKFGVFLKFALENGADYVATGHYAQVKESDGVYKLIAGADTNKDQSYFLWTLGQDQLKHTLFPVGHLEKPDVRKLAEKYDLHTADKKDSQGLCFIGKVDMKDFLRHYITLHVGKVLNTNGEVIGNHDGVEFLTIGERHGFTITEKTTSDTPLYVVAKNIADNTVTVSEETVTPTISHTLTLVETHSISGSTLQGKFSARIRYRQELFPIDIKGNIVTLLGEAQNVASGQSIVIYKENECVGGGIIA